MKKVTILPLIVLFSLSVFAQQISHSDVVWSDVHKPKTFNNVFKEILNDQLCMFWAYDQNISLRVFDEEMKVAQEYEINWSHEAKGEVVYESHVMAWGEMYIITRVEMKEQKRFDFFLQRLDTEGFKIDGEPKFLTSINYLRNGYLEHPEFWFSKNEKQLLVTHNNKTLAGNKFYTIRVFNEGFEEVQSLSLEHGSADFLKVTEFAISDEGRIAGFYIHNVPKKERVKGKPSKEGRLIEVKTDEIVPLEFGELDFGINDVELVFNSKEEIIVMGYYTALNNPRTIGTFTLKESSPGGEMIDNTRAFDKTDIGYFMHDKARTKLKNDLQNDVVRYMDQVNEDAGFVVRYIVPLKDGGFYQIGEISGSRKEWSTMSFQIGSVYGFDGIVMITRYDANLSVVWQSQIGKRNTDSQTGGRWGSFQYLINEEENLFFLHTDSKEYATRKERGGIPLAKARGKDAATCLTRVNNEGEVEKEVLFTEPEVELPTVPRFSLADQTSMSFTIWIMSPYAPLSLKLGQFNVSED